MPQELRNGAVLHGTYRIERTLGQGGFGITYLATDLSLDRKVAVKEFFPKDYCDRDSSTSHLTIGTQSARDFVERLRAKFLKEARNIAKFDHPGIIKIYAAFEENNTAYYVMEFIEGMSLWEKVKLRGPLGESEALGYINSVGKALEYVHAQKINHLDVKPANIMVRRSDNSPILIDFGLSKQYDKKGQQTSTTPTGISHGFAPIEQYNAGGLREFSPQTDLYSLAATLYFLLTGITPPQAIELIDTGLSFPDRFPARLVAPVSKAMSASRIMRQPTVGTFIAETAGAADPAHDEASTKPLSPLTEHETRPLTQPLPRIDQTKSGTKWVVISAICGALVVLGLFFALSGNDEPEEQIGVIGPNIDVVDMPFTNSEGITFLYTGEVTYPDSIPTGYGTGKYAEGTYTGEYVDGLRHGEAEYVTNDGENRFKGTYSNDKYQQGRLTLKDGMYYEGTFKNNNYDTGDFYNPDGSHNSRMDNGEYNYK